MFARKLLRENKTLRLSYVLKRYLEGITVAGVKPSRTSFQPLPKKKPGNFSYIYNFLAGNTDKEIFIYPEQAASRDKFYEWLDPIKTYISSCTDKTDRKQVLDQLRELEVFRTHIDEKYFGLNLSDTESLILVETLSNIPWLGTYIVKNHIVPVKIISKYASERQKQEFLPRIISGELTPTLCIFENDLGTNIKSIKSYIMPCNESSWFLNGQKMYVINGVNANLFLVFAKNLFTGSNQISIDSFSLLLVESNCGGINCTDIYDTIGRHEIPVCTIKFTDTLVPTENIIDKPGNALNILLECLKPGQQSIAGRSISLLRNFTNLLIPDILNIRLFDRDLYKLDITNKILGEIMFSLYTMESIAYLTAGLRDQYENPSVDIEQVITEIYCTNKCLQSIKAGLQLVGVHGYTNNKKYVQVLHDALAITTMDTNNLDGHIYAASAVLVSVVKDMCDHILKKRNFLQYPMYNIKHGLFTGYTVKIDSAHIHPALQDCITPLEVAINNFRDAVETIFVTTGSQSVEKYTDLYRMSEILTEIATFTSSYKINLITEELKVGPIFNCDNVYADFMNTVYQQRKYPVEHPLTKTY
ncbi:unnamed protein product [Xylocopa violacea]|uniref:Acyl-CoA dehydrogenase family member 9, mitochondrial n=2 Tax=Xylocopa violacea TaxID=135666 RepID=A0ABP1N3F0_XYLVO